MKIAAKVFLTARPVAIVGIPSSDTSEVGDGRSRAEAIWIGMRNQENSGTSKSAQALQIAIRKNGEREKLGSVHGSMGGAPA